MITYQEIYRTIDRFKPSQSRWEMAVLLRMVMERFDRPNVLEIGVHQGRSMKVWENILNPTLLVGIDPEPELAFDDLTVITNSSHNTEVINTVKNMYTAGIDFLFIDGDHSFDGVQQDMLMYSGMVNDGGLIAFHDILEGEPEVEAYWKSIREGYEHVQIWQPVEGTGTGVIFV